LKIGTVALLAWSVRYAPLWRQKERARLFRSVEAVGHWSMLDVYVVVLLAAFVRFGSVASVRPEPGLLAFAAVVFLTMLAAQSFDARLIWPAKDNTSEPRLILSAP
jgi:paraquat-inducible protein A